MSVKTRLLPCRRRQFSFFSSFLHSGVFDGSLRHASLILSFSLHLLVYPSPAESRFLSLLPDLPTFIISPIPSPELTSQRSSDIPFSVLKHKWMVCIQGFLLVSEINKHYANAKMARCSIVSDVTAVERQQTVWGQFYACGTHNEALAKSNLISFTQILSICVYRILLNCKKKQSLIYKFADLFIFGSGPLKLLIDLPTCSHSQLVTY